MSQYRYIFFQQKPQSFLSKIVATVLGIAVLVGAFLLGAVVLIAFFGFIVVMAIIVYARIWWLKRKFAGADPSATGGQGGTDGHSMNVLDGEYTVVDVHDDNKRGDN